MQKFLSYIFGGNSEHPPLDLHQNCYDCAGPLGKTFTTLKIAKEITSFDKVSATFQRLISPIFH